MTMFTLSSQCTVTRATPVGLPGDDAARRPSRPATGGAGTDAERAVTGVTQAPDGALWALAGGGAGPRDALSLFRWTGSDAAAPFTARYPDGPHRAGAVFAALDGTLVVVTEPVGGRSGLYAVALPPPPDAVLHKVGDLDLAGLPRPAAHHGAASPVTGAAVAPDGTHVALRTAEAAYEWDAPDGDVARALREGSPRLVPLDGAPGTGIAYSAEGTALVTLGQRLPAAVHRVAIRRAPPGEPAAATPLARYGPAVGGASVVLLLAAVVALAWQRRRVLRPVTVYRADG